MKRALAVLALCVPVLAEPATTLPEGNLLREWRGAATKIEGEEYHVVRDQASWEALWARHSGGRAAPRVAFDRETVLAVFNAGGGEVGWVRVTNLERPGLSRLWVGVCPAAEKIRYHVVVTGRSDLDVDFWTKDPALVREPGKEPERGGFAVEASLVHGAAGPWRARAAEPTDEQRAVVRAAIARMEGEDPGEREAAVNTLLRLGPCVRVLLETRESADPEVLGLLARVRDQQPTFDPSGKIETREHALWKAREFLVAQHPDLFSNDPEMRWEDWGARFHAGPAWTLTLRYL